MRRLHLPVTVIQQSALVLGPNVSTASDSINFGEDLILIMIMGKWPMLPTLSLGDIRNVSKHTSTQYLDKANDKRFILCAKSHEMVALARPLEAKYGKDYPLRARKINAQAYDYDHETLLWNPEWIYFVLKGGERCVFDVLEL